MKLRPRPNVLIHLKTTIFKQENDLNPENNKKKNIKNTKETAMIKNCTICSVSAAVQFVEKSKFTWAMLTDYSRIQSMNKRSSKTHAAIVFVKAASNNG